MGRTATIVRYAHSVWNGSAAWAGFAPATLATTSPGAHVELELLVDARHLNWADIYRKLASVSRSRQMRRCLACLAIGIDPDGDRN